MWNVCEAVTLLGGRLDRKQIDNVHYVLVFDRFGFGFSRHSLEYTKECS